MPNRPISEVIQGRKLVFADKDTTVQEASIRMHSANIGAILIMENGKTVGIFTERDCVYRVAAKGKHPEAVKLGSVMTENPVCVHVDRPFREALYLMSEGGFRHVPVLDESGHPISMVTPRDMLGSEHLELENSDVEREHISEIL